MADFVNDTFTEASDVTLQNHTGETGATWTKHSLSTRDLKVLASVDKVTNDNTITGARYGFYYASGTPATAEYNVYLTAEQTSAVGQVIYLCARWDVTSGTGTYYRVFYRSGSSGYRLEKVVNGTATSMGTYVVSLPASAKLELRITDAAKKFFLDDVERLSSGNNDITAAGKVGFIHYADSLAEGIENIDNFNANEAGGGGTALEGAAVAIAIATGALSTSISLSGAAASVATAAGNLTTSITLSSAALAQAIATAALSTGIPLDGTAAAIAAAVGELTTSITLSGGAIAQAIATGDLGGDTALSGAAAALSAATGDIATAIPLLGAAAGVADATGDLTTAIPLIGSAASVSSATGDLTVQITLTGEALATALAQGDLTVQITLQGAAIAQALATGALTDSVQFVPSLLRTLTVAAEDRALYIAAEYRTLEVAHA